AGLADAAWVRGDRDELTQVVQNLVQNGIKYGRPGGHVTIRLVCERAAASQGKETARRYRLSIADDGPGISPEHLPRLTERFYRVNVTSSREKGGTGLGLAIVKHIVNRHRGDLDIDSKVGQGSTFSVVLDAVEPADAARP
ncbi:MAG: two-component sensor histidine kinase, partial [Hyphomicrobiaceae bacterium]|nr:two-component sensor histidine kinase [Hyphomicrobiaceae bacterium]